MAVTGEHVGALSRLRLGDGEHCSVQRLEQKIEGMEVSRDGGALSDRAPAGDKAV